MSKSQGNVVTPLDLLDKYTSDGVRYWAASARLGVDTAFDEKVFKIGRRLVTKLFNASKFVLSQEGPVMPISEPLDLAFVGKLKALVEKVTADHEKFEYAPALNHTESFFWSQFTDTYLELAKGRARGEGDITPEAQGSAVAALRLGLNVLLRLFAPVVPFITEEVWSWVFAGETGHASIHTAPWPSADEFKSIPTPEDAGCFDLAVKAQAVINKGKADAAVSAGRVVEDLVLAANGETMTRFEKVAGDVFLATRVAKHELVTRTLEAPAAEGTSEEKTEAPVFVIDKAVYAEAPVKDKKA